MVLMCPLCTFAINTSYLFSEPCVKSANEEAVELATITAPTKPPPEDHHASRGGVNGFISPSEQTPPALQSVVQDGPVVAPNAILGKEATATQEPLERPVSLQDGPHPQTPAGSSQDLAQLHQVEAGRQPSLPTNSLSLDSAETSVLSPTSLADSELLEAVLDDAANLVPENPVDISVNVQIKESLSLNTDNVMESSGSNVVEVGESETTNKTSHIADAAGRVKGEEEQEHIIARINSQDKLVNFKHLDPRSNVTAVVEGTEGEDTPDGLQSKDVPSVSEAKLPPLHPEPKKQHGLFKRNKKKSKQGNLPVNLNKDHAWNASLLMCLNGKSLFLLFLFYITFYILCIGCFSVY